MSRESMSSFDIAVVISELNRLVKEAFIDNIYHVPPSTLLIKLRREGSSSVLLAEAGRRLHLTWYVVDVPERPSSFCMSMRKWLRNGRLVNVTQPESERIVALEILAWSGLNKLIIELFGKGNVILLSPGGEIRNVLHPRRMRDRNVIAGESFRMPPPFGPNLWRLRDRDMVRLRDKTTRVVAALGASLGVTSPYSDEALAVAGIDPAREAAALTEQELEALRSSLASLTEQASSTGIRPLLITDDEGRPQDFVPFPMRKYAASKCKACQSFNQAADDYFAQLSGAHVLEKRQGQLDQELAEQERILQQQLGRLKELQREAGEESRIADLIMADLPALEQLLTEIVSSRREGLPWEEVFRRTASQVPATPKRCRLVRIDPATHSLTVELAGTQLSLDFLGAPQEQAERRYLKAKEARRKILGVEAALRQARESAASLRAKHLEEREPGKPLQRRREKLWHERFHSFRSSEGFLVVAGKDASSNEVLVKRHVSPEDIVFHSEAPGAPFTIIKTEGRHPGESTIYEAAVFTVCHSKAWPQGLGSSSAFYVKPEQVTKQAPPGEYLARGSFMVLGRRNYIKGIPLRYGVGVKTSEGEVRAMGAPVESLSGRTDVHVTIVPGDESATKLARVLAERFARELKGKGLISPGMELSPEALGELIPAGRGRLLDGGN